MLIIAGIINVEADHRDALLEAVRPMVEATLEEEGCRDYVFSPDPNDPSAVRLFELWDSEEALAGHFASEHMATWRARSAELPVTGRNITKYTISESGPLG